MSDVYAALMAPGGLPTLDDLLDRPAWMADGACRENPAEWWFPTRGSNGGRAKAVCARCLVVDECAAYAATHDVVGVWGGVVWPTPWRP